jgi:transcriptional regulator with XRE-family HTH domain
MVDNSSESSLSKRLGGNIADRRKTLGWTQAMLAEQMSMEPESISRFERGATLPSLSTLEQLATILKTTIADLLAECPEATYTEAQRISALLSVLDPEARAGVLDIVERVCGLLKKS